MLLKTSTLWGFSCAAVLCAVVVVIGGATPKEQVMRTQLFKQMGEQRPVELATGDTLVSGDELYMILEARSAIYVYVFSEDAAGERLMIYPCRVWGRSPRIEAGQEHRLPGREGFWSVRSVTPRERLLVLASAHPLDFLDAAFMTVENPEPCAAPLGTKASRWIDNLIDSSGRKQEALISIFDFEGAENHG